MPKLTKRLSVAAIVLAAVTGAATAQQDFPTRPIQLMVAFPAGGSTDIAARIVASIAEKALGQPIVVVNRGGAGGQIGWTELVRQKPDGYYLGCPRRPKYAYAADTAKPSQAWPKVVNGGSSSGW